MDEEQEEEQEDVEDVEEVRGFLILRNLLSPKLSSGVIACLLGIAEALRTTVVAGVSFSLPFVDSRMNLALKWISSPPPPQALYVSRQPSASLSVRSSIILRPIPLGHLLPLRSFLRPSLHALLPPSLNPFSVIFPSNCYSISPTVTP